MFFDTCPVISCCVKSYAGVWLRAAEKKISDTLWAHDVPPKNLFYESGGILSEYVQLLVISRSSSKSFH